jgi:hypothetical protein
MFYICSMENYYLSDEQMSEYLNSIGGLCNGYFTDKGPIVDPGFFCVGNGWFGLIKSLINDLTELGWNKETTQVKEKFGGLRFYINAGSDEIHQRILQAEKESYKVCEKCGEPGELRKDIGWYFTLCDTHHKLTKNSKTKVSFDYDGTLALPSVEEFAKELVDEGYEVWVVTSRVSEEDSVLHPWGGTDRNKDLWESCERIGIPKHRVKFTHHADKIEFLKDMGFTFHLDDDLYELTAIMESKDKCRPLNVGHSDWRINCLEELKK